MARGQDEGGVVTAKRGCEFLSREASTGIQLTLLCIYLSIDHCHLTVLKCSVAGVMSAL